MKHLVVLGGGTGGTVIANRMCARLGADWRVTVIDRDDQHIYQPGLLLLPFGVNHERELVRSRRRTLDRAVRLELGEVRALDRATRTVHLADGRSVGWDVLVVATGCQPAPGETAGLTDGGWGVTTHEFYTLAGSMRLRDALRGFRGGRVVVNFVDLPIKCPVAPLEMAFLLEAMATERGVRAATEIVYATPLEGAFSKPIASRVLGDVMAARGISVVPDFSVSEVDGAGGAIRAFDGRSVPFDLLVTVPVNSPDPLVAAAGLGDAGGWMRVDRHTLQSLVDPTIFGIGDTTDVPTSKAGAAAHYQAEALATVLEHYLADQPLPPAYDGHATCFVETGHGRAMLLDFDYAHEPATGRYPLPGVGPFTLLEESAANHWGKLAFKWMYWNGLLPGGELPMESRYSSLGKWS